MHWSVWHCNAPAQTQHACQGAGPPGPPSVCWHGIVSPHMLCTASISLCSARFQATPWPWAASGCTLTGPPPCSALQWPITHTSSGICALQVPGHLSGPGQRVGACEDRVRSRQPRPGRHCQGGCCLFGDLGFGSCNMVHASRQRCPGRHCHGGWCAVGLWAASAVAGMLASCSAGRDHQALACSLR